MPVGLAFVLSGVLDWAVGAPVIGYGLLCLTGLAVVLAIYVRQTLSSYLNYCATRYQVSK